MVRGPWPVGGPILALVVDTLPDRTDDDESIAPARAPGPLSLAGRRGLAGVKASLFGATASAERFGRYRIGRRLGAGAFGEVYEATDSRLDRRGPAWYPTNRTRRPSKSPSLTEAIDDRAQRVPRRVSRSRQ